VGDVKDEEYRQDKGCRRINEDIMAKKLFKKLSYSNNVIIFFGLLLREVSLFLTIFEES